MPSGYIPNQLGLQTSSELLLARGRSFIFGNTWFLLPSPPSASCSKPFSSYSVARVFHTGDRRAPPASVCAAALSRTHSLGCAPSSVGNRGLFQRGIMAASGHLLGNSQFGNRRYESVGERKSASVNTIKSEYGFRYKGIDHCSRVSARLKNREPWTSNMLYKCFWSNATGIGWKPGYPADIGFQDFHSSCAAPYSTGAAHQVSFDGAPRDVSSTQSTVPDDQKAPEAKNLKLLSGACYLPHPDKEDTGGEDAHFICIEQHAIGVADGVGGWAEVGVDAGKYARELMSNSLSAIKEEPKGSVDPLRVLEKAYSSTRAKGSSTACILALTEQGLQALNLGDSGFIVVRKGSTVFKSQVQQHSFNFTYQLESGNGCDLPSSAQVFNITVAPGDVIVAGTDGLFDNLYNHEITAVVVNAERLGLGPQVAAQKIAALARQRAQDKHRQTPFSTAAQEAGYRFYGGKLDDVTVVVAYVAGEPEA